MAASRNPEGVSRAALSPELERAAVRLASIVGPRARPLAPQRARHVQRRRPSGLSQAARPRRLSGHARRADRRRSRARRRARSVRAARRGHRALRRCARRGDAVVIGLNRLRRILSIDPENRRAVVEPGVVNATLHAPRRAYGLHYAPDPSSQTACTIGGNVAENAGGPHCLKYGVTLNHVVALTVILPDGELVSLGSANGEREGLRSARRVRRLGGLLRRRARRNRAPGDESGGGSHAARRLHRHRGRRARRIGDHRLGDRARGAGDDGRSDDPGRGGVDLRGRISRRRRGRAAHRARRPRRGSRGRCGARRRLCREAGARSVRIARDEAERARLWQGRKKAFGAMGRISPDLVVQDAVVPRTRLPDVLAEIHRIAQETGVLVCNVFHAGRRQPAPEHRLRRARRRGDGASPPRHARDHARRASPPAGRSPASTVSGSTSSTTCRSCSPMIRSTRCADCAMSSTRSGAPILARSCRCGRAANGEWRQERVRRDEVLFELPNYPNDSTNYPNLLRAKACLPCRDKEMSSSRARRVSGARRRFG